MENGEKLFKDAIANDFARARTLVTAENVNALKYPKHGWSLLHMACANGVYDAVVWLINMKADVNATDMGLHTPLHNAALKGFPTITQVLLAAGADPRLANHRSEIPLHKAILSNNRACVSLLLNAYPDGVKRLDSDQQTAFSDTVYYRGDTFVDKTIPIAQLLLDAKSDIDHINREFRTPLCQALLLEDDEMIELLLDRGASFEAVLKASKGKSTPIYKRDWIEKFLEKRNCCREAAWTILALFRKSPVLQGNGKDVLILIAKRIWESRKNEAWYPPQSK